MVMSESTGIPQLDAFRALVRREIEAELERDGYHKRMEGAVRYMVELPPVVDWSDMPDPLNAQPCMDAMHTVDLYCYVIGPARRYQWHGRTVDEVFAKATDDFLGFVAADAAERALDGE